jgi:hypothetical protein
MLLSTVFKIPILASLGVIVAILVVATVASLRRKIPAPAPDPVAVGAR